MRVEGRKSEVTVYLDAIWLLNFLLDFMILLLVKALTRDNSSKIRICFGAFVASLIVPISVFYPLSFFTSVIGKLIYSIFIILCTFGFKTVFKVLKLLSMFYFLTFAIGGGLLATHFFLADTVALTKSGVVTFDDGYGTSISWIFILLGFPIVWLFTKSRMDKHAIEKIKYDALYPVSIELRGKTVMTTGYIDSGNHLIDPVTKKPVVICDEVLLKNWFSNDEWEQLKDAYKTFDLSKVPSTYLGSITLIPYQGVGGNKSFLFAFRPEQLIINYDKQMIHSKNLLIGIQFSNLTNDDSYHCLLQPSLIKISAVS